MVSYFCLFRMGKLFVCYDAVTALTGRFCQDALSDKSQPFGSAPHPNRCPYQRHRSRNGANRCSHLTWIQDRPVSKSAQRRRTRCPHSAMLWRPVDRVVVLLEPW